MNTLEQQPDFPSVDLTEKNVDFLREFFAQPNLMYTISPENPDGRLEEFLNQFELVSHDSGIESEHKIYTEAFAALQHAQIPALSDGHFGLVLGYSLHKSIRELVSNSELVTPDVPTRVAMRSLTEAVRRKSLPDFLDDAKKEFVEKQKNATQLIGKSVAKFSIVSVEEALLGASVERVLALASREYLQKPPIAPTIQPYTLVS